MSKHVSLVEKLHVIQARKDGRVWSETWECSSCKWYVQHSDNYCRNCGVKFGRTVSEERRV